MRPGLVAVVQPLTIIMSADQFPDWLCCELLGNPLYRGGQEAEPASKTPEVLPSQSPFFLEVSSPQNLTVILQQSFILFKSASFWGHHNFLSSFFSAFPHLSPWDRQLWP